MDGWGEALCMKAIWVRGHGREVFLSMLRVRLRASWERGGAVDRKGRGSREREGVHCAQQDRQVSGQSRREGWIMGSDCLIISEGCESMSDETNKC